MAARGFFNAFQAAEVSVTSTVAWTTAVSLTFTPRSGVDYAVFWSFEGTKTTGATSAMLFRISVNGVAAESGQLRSRAAGEYPLFFAFLRLQGDGAAKTVAIEILNASGTEPSVARNASLTALALAEGDLYAESLARTQTGDETLAPLTGVSATAPAGSYLLFGCSMSDNPSGTAPAFAGLNFNGAASKEFSVGHPAATDLRPLAGVWRRTLAADGLLTAQWRGRSLFTGHQVGWRSSRVLVLRLSGFDAAHYAELATDSDGPEAAWTNVLQLATTTSANPHLVIAAFCTGSTTTAAQYCNARLLEDGAEVGKGVQRAYATNIDRAGYQGLSRVRSGMAAGAKVWTAQRQSDGPGGYPVRVTAGSVIAALDLGAAGATLTALQGGYVATGPVARLAVQRQWRANMQGFVFAGLGTGLGRGFRLGLAPRAFDVAAFGAVLRRGLRLSSGVGGFDLIGPGVRLSKSVSGLKLVSQGGEFTLHHPAAAVSASRRIVPSEAHFAVSPLGANLKRDLRLGGDAASLLGEGRPMVWGWTHIAKPHATRFDLNGADMAMRYGGLLLWQAAPSPPGGWSVPSRTDEDWTPIAATSEFWN